MNNRLLFHNFYIKIGIKIGLICVLCYAFMLCQFTWGNHDWSFIKKQVNLTDGLFEARFSQHIFTALLFTGQVLPVLTLLTGIIALALQTLVIGSLLELPKNTKTYLLFGLFLSLSPYNFTIFNYIYLIIPFILWSTFAICGLYLAQPPYNYTRFGLGSIIYLIFLGAYPPATPFVLIIFLSRELNRYISKHEPFNRILKNALFFSAQFATALLIHKLITTILIAYQIINLETYNLKLYKLPHMLTAFFNQIPHIWQQFTTPSPFIGQNYISLTCLGIIAALALIIKKARTDWKTYLFLVGIFFCTRLIFIISPFAQFSYFRIEYWSRLGIFAFAASVLLQTKKTLLKNLIFIWFIVVIALSVKIDYTVQKAWVLGFKAERLYHTRVVERLITNPKFNPRNKYSFTNFGQPNFRTRFHVPVLPNLLPESDIAAYNALPCDLGHILFWDETASPISIGSGFTNEGLLHAPLENKNSVFTKQHWKNNPENIQNVTLWAYEEAAIYPQENSFYIDDKYIIFAADSISFNKNKKILLLGLDK